MAKLVNLTPHSINVLDKNNQEIMAIPSTGIARCTVVKENIGSVNNIPINASKFGEVEGLPEAQQDTIYIVSLLVAQAVANRKDILIVDDTVRDEQGRIIGCRAFGKVGV